MLTSNNRLLVNDTMIQLSLSGEVLGYAIVYEYLVIAIRHGE